MRLVIFDLDGVLVRAKEVHFNALNESLKSINPNFAISYNEHLNFYDGLKTRDKLKLLTEKKGLPPDSYDKIWEEKQRITAEQVKLIEKDQDIINLLDFLTDQNIKIACCSNSIRKSVNNTLTQLGIINFFDFILSNEDVKNAKPHPEMYWEAMSFFSVNPEDTLIVEDSPHGLLAAQRSGAYTFRVKDPSDLTISRIKPYLKQNKKPMSTTWQDKNLNVLVPMAGAGSRFQEAGYTFPKPLIEVRGKPMIQVVVENLNCESPHTFIAQKSRRNKYN